MSKHKKRILTLATLAMLGGGTLVQPLLYAPRVLAEETSASSSSSSATSPADATAKPNSGETSTSKVVEKESIIIPDSSVYYIQIGYEFDDGSFDEWGKGTGFLVSNQEILTIQSLADTSTSSTVYKAVLEKKGDAYKSAGIDLRNEKEVDKHFIIRVTNTSGEVLKVKSKTTKNGLGLISLEKTTSSTPGIFEEEADVKTEEGTKYKLKTTATSGSKAIVTESEGSLVKPPSNATGGTLALKLDSNSGEVLGAPIYNPNGNIIGMVTGVGESLTVVPSSGLQTFLTNNDVKFDTKKTAEAKRAAKEKEAADKALEDANKASISTKNLEKAIADAEAVDKSGYKEESYDAMANALEEAKKVLANENHTQAELDSAQTKLTDAYNALEPYTLMDRLFLPLVIGGSVIFLGIIIFVIIKIRKKMQMNPRGKKRDNEDVSFTRNDYDDIEEMRRMDEADLARSNQQMPPTSYNYNAPRLERRNDQGFYESMDSGLDITDQVAPAGLRTGNTNIPGVTFAQERDNQPMDLSNERYGVPLTPAGMDIYENGEEETTVLGRSSYLVRKDNGKQITLRDGFIIGKERNKVNYCISGNSSVSRTHAQFRVIDGIYHIEDLRSKNYTYLNGNQLPAYKPAQLKDGDVIKLSDVEFVFHA